MSILDSIHSPQDVRSLSFADKETLCDELRSRILDTVSVNGGHLSSNLGVVELTVALHTAFSVPHDVIVWDVGHQCYAHKLLTGRADRFNTLRKKDGLSGFPRPCENEADSFVVGHSSTSVSAAAGIAHAKYLAKDTGYTVAVIGDGALTGGLSYEGLSNAARRKERLIVILNDNRMSINQNVGFIARHLATLRAIPRYVQAKDAFLSFLSHIPFLGKFLIRLTVRAKCRLKTMIYRSSSMFEEMGYYYLGPIDGHNLKDLTRAMQTARSLNRPVLLHVETIKGKGYSYAENDPESYHGVASFDPATGIVPQCRPCFSRAAGDALCELAAKDPKLCVVTAAMTNGTGLQAFAKTYPDRFFDVGIAEEHAVTFSSGLATGGVLPVFAVYSTFLQRTYDQILNDTAIMNNHIVLLIDRAGLVPDDGETHQGLFDTAFLSTIPHVTVFAPATFAELKLMLYRALYQTEGIAVVRYPKGGEPAALSGFEAEDKPFVIFENPGALTAIITYGRLTETALKTAAILKNEFPVSVIKLNRIHPLPTKLLSAVTSYKSLLFLEEGEREGGIAQQLGSLLMEHRYPGAYRIRAVTGFVAHGSVKEGMKETGLDTESVVTLLREDANGVK